MIINYESYYDEDIKNLFVELQEYIVSIDKEGYNIITSRYRDEYFEKTMKEINDYKGKMFLYIENNELLGLIVGIINNDEINSYDFKVPKRGRVTELIVSKNARSKGIGSLLLEAMEHYLRSVGCHDILIGVFGYNDNAISFYGRNGYHTRMVEVTKNIL